MADLMESEPDLGTDPVLQSSGLRRTMAAILAADVAGYSRLVAADEEDTLRRLAEHSRVFKDFVARFDGRVFNTAGDSILAQFPSAVGALKAAIGAQQALRLRNQVLPPDRRLEFRMGITVGDVVERDGDLLGDDVNIAARLEGCAEAGGICVSRAVYEAAGKKVPARFKSLGRQKLKNLGKPIEVYRVLVHVDEPASRNRLRGWGRPLAGLLVLGIGAGLFYAFKDGVPSWFPQRGAGAVTAQDSSPDRIAMTVSAARPERLCFSDRARVGGTVLPRRIVEVRPETDGYRIAKVMAEPLAVVREGQVLAELTPPEGRPGPNAQLKAPVAGTIGKSIAAVGMQTSSQMPALFTLIEGGDLELAAQVPLAKLDALAVGQTVAVTPVGLSTISGKVRSIGRSTDPATQLGQIRVSLAPDPALRWGTFARGLVTIGERCGLSVPFSALLRTQDGAAVYVINKDRVEARAVTTGLSAGDDVEIPSGLSEADNVIQRAAPFLREGDPVRAAPGRTRSAS